LKYRATKNGFKSADLHSKCDGVANTLTLIKAKSGNIFGGFTEKEWHSDDDFVTDPNAFIFSLVSKKKKTFKAGVQMKENRRFIVNQIMVPVLVITTFASNQIQI